MSTAIVWFRRDLRLADNPALSAAIRAGHRILPLYIHAPAEEAPWQAGGASQWWLHQALAALAADLQARGSDLLLRSGNSLAQLEQLAETCRADAVYWNRVYDPALIERDERIKRALRRRGLHVESHNGALLIEPWQVQTGQGDPYKVFTPFWKNASARLGDATTLPAPEHMSNLPDGVTGDSLADWALLPRIAWDGGLHENWQPGEDGAQARLREFLDGAIGGYRERRDFPAEVGTSKLSPHLHFGEISPRQIRAAIDAASASSAAWQDNATFYLRELGWREFSHHLIYHFPDTTQAPLNPRFQDFPWREDAGDLRTWQQGRTGIPIVDAGMRELWHTGWMHNRVRMVVASFLTKNLRLHWLHGARWFWDTLVDADLANNTQGWQWTAGSGADAAPYFRIFNPVSQGERFDPDGVYVGSWIPELRALPVKWCQQPWAAPTATLDAAGLAKDSPYRQPMVDLKKSREQALAAYATIKAPTPN